MALTALLELWPLRLLVFLPAGFTVWRSLAALKVELLPGLSAAGMREELLMRQPVDAQLAIYDYFTFRHNEMVDVLTAKADRVDKAARWLAATIGVLALAGLLDGVI